MNYIKTNIINLINQLIMETSLIYEVGVDEVGRGCLFGPVVSAAVVMPIEFSEDDILWKQIKDSKKLSEKKRIMLNEYIKNIAISYGIGICSHSEIDKINILKASLKSMHIAVNNAYKMAVENNKPIFEKIIVDGNRFNAYCPPGEDSTYIPHECYESGDNKYLNIAAASIIAKTYRDNIIIEGCKENDEWNRYDLLKNKGYGTAKHMSALKQYGPIEGHRFSYKPVQLYNM